MHGRLLNLRSGMTLIELVIAIAVLSIVLVTLLALSSQGTQRSADPMLQEQASAIAQAYLEEIRQKNFCDPDRDLNLDADGDPTTNPHSCPSDCAGPVCQAGGSGCRNNGAATEGARALYDDICDYQGLSDSGAVDQNGSSIPGLGQYQVDVNVIDNGADLNGLLGSAGRSARIDVTVSHPALPDDVKLSGYRANY